MSCQFYNCGYHCFRLLCVALPGVSPYYVKLPFGRLGPGWNETDPDQLRMAWKPSLLSQDQNATVTIDLIGYRETSTVTV